MRSPLTVLLTLVAGLVFFVACSAEESGAPGHCRVRIDATTSASVTCRAGQECGAPPVNTFYASLRSGPEERNCGSISCHAPECHCVSAQDNLCECSFY